MHIRKIFRTAFSLLCSLFQLKTEFQEITDFKKSYKELKAFPEPNKEILKTIEDEMKHMQKNILEECQVCLVTYDIFSSEFVLLKCGHEVCRNCFPHPRMKFCPNCREEKKEYTTKFDELTEKQKAQRKKNKKDKIKKENNIMKEYEALKYVLQTLTPKRTTKKLMLKEIKKYEAKIYEQRELHFVAQKLITIAKAIWKPLNSSRLGKKTKRVARSLRTTLGLDSIDCDETIGTVQLWLHLGEIVPGEVGMGAKYFAIIKLVVLKMILHYAARKFFKYVPKNESNYSFHDPMLNVLFLAYDLWKTPKLWTNILFGFTLFHGTKLSLLHNLGFFGSITSLLWENPFTNSSLLFLLFIGTLLLKRVNKHGFLYICKYLLLVLDAVHFIAVFLDVVNVLLLDRKFYIMQKNI